MVEQGCELGSPLYNMLSSLSHRDTSDTARQVVPLNVPSSAALLPFLQGLVNV